MSNLKRSDIIADQTGARGIVLQVADDRGKILVSRMSDGELRTVGTVWLTLVRAAQPFRRGDVVRAMEDGDRGVVRAVYGDTVDVYWWDSGLIGGAYIDDIEIVNRRRYSPAIAAMMDGWDSGDVWGTAMSMAWAVAEVARAAELERDTEAVDTVDLSIVPEILEVSWGMTPALSIEEMAGVEEDPENRGDVSFETGTLAAAYQRGDVTDADLAFAARVLDRYLDICRAAGLDY